MNLFFVSWIPISKYIYFLLPLINCTENEVLGFYGKICWMSFEKYLFVSQIIKEFHLWN